jgi:hypothetical protein
LIGLGAGMSKHLFVSVNLQWTAAPLHTAPIWAVQGYVRSQSSPCFTPPTIFLDSFLLHQESSQLTGVAFRDPSELSLRGLPSTWARAAPISLAGPGMLCSGRQGRHPSCACIVLQREVKVNQLETVFCVF